MKCAMIVLSATILIAVLGLARGVLRAETASKTSLFVIVNSPGEAWDKSKSVFEQPIQEHLTYVKGLLDSGVMIFGGPFTDNAGGLILLECESIEKAQEIAANDPAAKSKLMVPAVHPFMIGMIRDGVDLHPAPQTK